MAAIRQNHGASARILTLTLERSIGKLHGCDRQLWETGHFDYAVYPRLPIATTWKGLAKAVWRLNAGTGTGPPPSVDSTTKGSQRVSTLAANLARVSEFEAMIRDACFEDELPAALFCVSGSHPVRNLPGLSRLLPGSLQLLETAARLRAAGRVPASVHIWAAANPVTEADAAYAEAKAACGAEAFLTQPPLAWDNFARWMDDARRRGVAGDRTVIVGVPVLTSPRNLSFWIQLCAAPFAGEQAALLEVWRQNEKRMAPEEFQAFVLAWNRDLIGRIKGTDGVAGLHVMPFGGKGRQVTMQLIEDGTL